MQVDLVGILNVTPDSFSDGGRFLDPAAAIAHVEQLFADGAAYIDIGAEATNPWAEPLDADTEWARLEPILSVLLPAYDSLRFSLDTRHASVVERASAYGTFMANDVTTFVDPALRQAVATHGLWAIASHMPLAARGDIHYAHEHFKIDDVQAVADELAQQVTALIGDGVARERIIIDPGIGFGKSTLGNWHLADTFGAVAARHPVLDGLPIMYGVSRKRFLATDRTTGEPRDDIDRLHDPAVSVRAMQGIIKSSPEGSNLLFRVHDVAAHKAAIN